MTVSTRPTDSELVRRARTGERRAVTELLERHYGALFAACRRALRDAEPARDAAQQAALRAVLGLERLRQDDRFGSWLIGIGLNVCRELVGSRAGREASLEALLDAGRLAEPPSDGPDPHDAAERADTGARVREAIAALPAGQREAVALFYLAGLTHAEVAEALGTRPGAVKTRLHKARRTLRAPLHDLHEEHATMPSPAADLLPVRIADLRRTPDRDPDRARHVLFLEALEGGGGRRLPIWIGEAEAVSLAVVLEEVELPRPGPYHFAAALLQAAGGTLAEVRVTELTEHTFYAQAVLADGSLVDARPSDALTLATVTGAPILVAPAVLAQAEANAAELADLVAEAEAADEDARTLADEARARIAAMRPVADEPQDQGSGH